MLAPSLFFNCCFVSSIILLLKLLLHISEDGAHVALVSGYLLDCTCQILDDFLHG